jgi:hypothetical protein
MSNAVSVVLLLVGLFWIDPAGAQRAPRDSPSGFLSVREGQLTADINRIPLRLVLEELARQVPLRLSVSGEWREHLVTAHFRALALDEAVARLLVGIPYGILYAPTPYTVGPAAARQIGELMVFETTPAARVAGNSEAPTVTSNTGLGRGQGQETTLDTTPEWTVALAHPDKKVRLEALQGWAAQGAATPLDPLTRALVDPDESVRARAQELVERVWAAKAEAGAR